MRCKVTKNLAKHGRYYGLYILGQSKEKLTKEEKLFYLGHLVENFKLNAGDTMYNHVKTNIYGDRDQELPRVSEVAATSPVPGLYLILPFTNPCA